MVQYSVFVSGSNVPDSHVAPPPHSIRPAHVSAPGSPFAGMVCVRQISSPVFGDRAAMNPRIPLSPPALPTMTLSLTMSGADVEVVPFSVSANFRLKMKAPVCRSSAVR